MKEQFDLIEKATNVKCLSTNNFESDYLYVKRSLPCSVFDK